MSEMKWQVCCDNVATARLLATTAREAGWKRKYDEADIPARCYWLWYDGEVLYADGSHKSGTETLTIPQAIERIQAGPPKDDSIYVNVAGCGKVKVVFYDHGAGIDIGGEVFPRETLRRIAHRLKEGPIRLREHEFLFFDTGGDSTYVCYRNTKLTADEVKQILERAGVTAEPEPPPPEPGILREFVEAVATNGVPAFALKRTWANLQGDFLYTIAQKVLEKAKDQPTPPASFTDMELGKLRTILHRISNRPGTRSGRCIDSMLTKIGHNPELGCIETNYRMKFLKD